MDYIPKVKFIPLKEAARLFGVSEHFVRKIALAGSVTAIRPGTKNGKILVEIHSLESFLGSQKCSQPVLSA
jgi:hypothetical protein